MGKVRRKKINVSTQAKQDIDTILHYLRESWNQKIIDDFLAKLEMFYAVVSNNPRIFGLYSKKWNIRNYAITKNYTIYYTNKLKVIEVWTIFDNRRAPSDLKKTLRSQRQEQKIKSSQRLPPPY